MYVEPLEASCDLERAWAAIQPVFGVAGLSRAKACEKDKDAFFETASTYLHDQLMAAKTFKVESKRADKSFPMTSIELSQYVGGMIHDAYPHLKVDVHEPEFTSIWRCGISAAMSMAIRLPARAACPWAPADGAWPCSPAASTPRWRPI